MIQKRNGGPGTEGNLHAPVMRILHVWRRSFVFIASNKPRRKLLESLAFDGYMLCVGGTWIGGYFAGNFGRTREIRFFFSPSWKLIYARRVYCVTLYGVIGIRKRKKAVAHYYCHSASKHLSDRQKHDFPWILYSNAGVRYTYVLDKILCIENCFLMLQ